MTAGLYQTVVTIPKVSGIPEDAVENVWHFASDTADTHATVQTDIVSKLTTFYNTDLGASMANTLAFYMGGQLARTTNSCSFRTYFTDDLTGATFFGSPVATTSWTLGTGGAGTSFPSEVSACLSFHGDLTDIPETEANPVPPPAFFRPAARRRGRLFIGPLVSGTSDATGDIHVAATYRADLAAAAANVMAQNDTLSAWVVWSKMDGAVYPVAGGFVDNAFDTQRRRGPDATTRTNF